MKLEEKYPNKYFNHWLAMLATMNAEFNKEGFETQIEHYLNFEGEEQMKMLQREVKLIVESGDLFKFNENDEKFEQIEVDKQSLELMAKVILHWNK